MSFPMLERDEALLEIQRIQDIYALKSRNLRISYGRFPWTGQERQETMKAGQEGPFFPLRRLINLGVPLDFPLEFKTEGAEKS